MDAEQLSRIQFGFTASFHFIFPPLSMGLGIMLVAMGIASVHTHDLKWRRLALFWTQIYGLIFALGVATGIVQEFEFGTNWAVYSRFVGNVFGSLLAAEGIFAFFLEGGFLGLMLFGGTRLGPRLWLAATCIVVFAAHFSALWIIMANSWMQTPDGYKLVTVNGVQQAQMTSFVDVMFTPSFLAHIFHVFVASWTAGSALVLSVSAWYILKKRYLDLARASFKLSVWPFAIFAIVNLCLAGANQAVEVTNNQEVKLAAIEGLFNDQSCAPLYIFGWVDESAQTTKGLHVPCLLSFLSYGSVHSTVQGLNSFPQSDWAPVNLSFQAYHLMFDLAMFFAALGIVAAGLYVWKKKALRWRWLLWLCVVNVVLTEVAIIAGWWTAEIGRQPWIVWNLLRTSDGVSTSITTAQAAASLIMFALLYSVLLVLFLVLLNARIRQGPPDEAEAAADDVAQLPNTLREIFRRRGAHALVPADAVAAPPPPEGVQQ